MDQKDGIALVIRAAAFAAQKHRTQRRKDLDASPYINHPLQVASIISEEGGNTDAIVLAAALLHDTLEDTRTSSSELTERFGESVANIVLEVTDDKGLPKDERKRLQIEHAPTLTPAARFVKLADKIANLRDLLYAPPANWSIQRRTEYFEWAAQVVAAIPDPPPALLSAFQRELERRPDKGGDAAAGLERAKGIAKHLGRAWSVVIRRYVALRKLSGDPELARLLSPSYATHVHNAVVDALTIDLIRGVCALILDRDTRAASSGQVLALLDDPGVLEELRKDYDVTIPARMEGNDLDAETRAEVARVIHEAELKRNRAEYTTLKARVDKAADAVRGHSATPKLIEARNRAVAHNELVRDGSEWRAWTMDAAGLKWGDVDSFLQAATEVVTALELFVRRTSYSFSKHQKIDERYADEFTDALKIGLAAHRAKEDEERARLRARRDNPEAPIR